MTETAKLQLFLVEFDDRVASWCQIGRSRETSELEFVDFKGRHVPRDKGRALKVADVDRYDDVFRVEDMFLEILRRSADRHLIDPESDQGWIDDRGVFYGCRFFNHDDLAHAFFMCPVGALEGAGYVRVHENVWLMRSHRHDEPNSAQRKTLESLGFYDVEQPHRRLPEKDRGRIPGRSLYVPGGFVKPPPFRAASIKVVRDLRAYRLAAGLSVEGMEDDEEPGSPAP